MTNKRELDPHKFAQPATKGDLIQAMVLIRSCIVDSYVTLSAMRRGDEAAVAKAMSSLSKNDQLLGDAIFQIGGKDQ